MLVGVPKEIKNQESRVGLTPASVKELVLRGHQVLVQQNAGAAIGLTDAMYEASGASIVAEASEIFARAEMIVKVKEPQPQECAMLREGQILYTYLHLAPDPEQTKALVASGAVCIAYETITGERRLAAAGADERSGGAHVDPGWRCAPGKSKGGMGLLLGGVPGVAPGHIAIIGAGVVGTNALQMAVGIGARVTILDKNIDRLRQLDLVYGNRIATMYSNAHSIEEAVLDADLVIGGVLVPGAAAPKLVTKSMIARMKQGAVVVDVAIDQGGCFETSHATTHEQPTYVVDGVVHYCVANMPGAVARTSTFALNNATIGHAVALADKGWQKALKANPHLKNGLNVCQATSRMKRWRTALAIPM
jgi:alanine dehydrogenase